MNILIVLTSHASLGNTGRKTGFWLEELAAPYWILLDAGATLSLASPAGGRAPIDPASEAPEAQTDSTRRFTGDTAAMTAVSNTLRLVDVEAAHFDAVFYAGGHGPLWDLVDNPASIRLIEQMAAADKPLALVCHAPAVLRFAKGPDGRPLVAGKEVTGFSNAEEDAARLTDVVPFLLQDVLQEEGARYSKQPPFEPHVVTDGRLVTGQNPASSAGAARRLLALLG
jgi:putative intracellular protease/amidase